MGKFPLFFKPWHQLKKIVLKITATIACGCEGYTSPQFKIISAMAEGADQETGIGVVGLFHRVWPPAVVAVALIATTAWVVFLGYELFRLGGWVF